MSIDLSKIVPDIKAYLLNLQNSICHMLEKHDGKSQFIEDAWSHREGGFGLTRVLEKGALIEKAGVNFSHVLGGALPHAATVKRPELANSRFQALGVSVVVHPINPYVPTTHLNVRFVSVENEAGSVKWWFGGGFDLTPYYGFKEDVLHWHKTAKAACDPFGLDVYPRYKKACDDYFYLPHRDEPRGIGGIFFDDLNEWGVERSFALMRSVGDHFILAYEPIIQKRKERAYTQHERDFQSYRRGRYVEFNLLYDRGTLFGLQSKGRTESILMSLPPAVAFHYNYKPIAGSEEEKLYTEFLIRKEWI